MGERRGGAGEKVSSRINPAIPILHPGQCLLARFANCDPGSRHAESIQVRQAINLVSSTHRPWLHGVCLAARQ